MIATGMPRAVVDDRDRVVRVDRDLDRVAAAGQRLVDRVVDDLVDEVVQAAHAGRADVHARPLADRLETLEDGDVLGVVAAIAGCSVVAVVLEATVPFVYTSDAPASGRSRPRPGRGLHVVIILAGGPLGTAARSVTKVLQNRAKISTRSARPASAAFCACTRKRRTAGLPSAALRRSTTSSDIRSSSCARTAAGHATVTIAVALAERLGVRRERLAGRVRPRALDLGEQRRRRQRRGQRVERVADRARARGASSARPLVVAAACSTRPSAIATRSTPGVLGAGHVAELGRGDDALAAGAQHVDQPRRGARASSSLITSSSSSSGGAPRSAASSSRSASSSASRPSRSGRASRRSAARGRRGAARGRRGAGRGR